jgi:hypothetical protein
VTKVAQQDLKGNDLQKKKKNQCMARAKGLQIE